MLQCSEISDEEICLIDGSVSSGLFSNQSSDFHTSQVKWRNCCLQGRLYSSFTCDEHVDLGTLFTAQNNLFIFCIFSLIQVWLLSSRRKEASVWKPWPSLIWREDRTVSLQGLFSQRGCLVMCAFKCNQRRSESWRWFSQGLYLRKLQHLKFHTIEICQFNLIVTMLCVVQL